MNGIYSASTSTSRPTRQTASELSGSRISSALRWLSRLCDRVCLLIAFLVFLFRQPEVRRCLRGIAVTVCLLCFIGLIGGIEQGLISVGMGIVLGLLLLFIEILCLRPEDRDGSDD